MLGNAPFYHALTRKYVGYFGSLFSQLYVERKDGDNNVAQLIKVPISYGQKSTLLRADADPDLQRQAATIYPRMSFEHDNPVYDGDRKLNSLNRLVKKDDTDSKKVYRQFQSVPYTIPFKLYIASKFVEDGLKVVEQILPFFTPDWTTSVELIEEMNWSMDIPVVLRSVQHEDSYEAALQDRRLIMWTLDFDVLAYYWGPVVKKPIIKFTNTYLHIGSEGDPVSGTIYSQPGLLANGQPTTNSSASVSLDQIFIDSNYGYCVETDDGQVEIAVDETG